MSTLQERLRREADFMLDRGIVTRGQRLVSAGEMREAADALDAAAIDLSEAKRAWRYERDRADAAVAKLDAISASVDAYMAERIGSSEAIRNICRILHPQGGNR